MTKITNKAGNSENGKNATTANKKQSTEKSSGKSNFLNPSLTFDTFIVGSSNQFAYTAAKSVSEKPGQLYNPLFLYGGVGLGKTHLLQAIGNAQIAQGKNVVYATLETFMNTFASHIRNQTMDRFRKKFRECDLLLIDDIQFISRKEQTQEEFFHTFNELYNAKKQIVLTADRPPNKIAGLVDRLKTRFELGLIVDTQPPELETKIEIIKKISEINHLRLDLEIINYIAENIEHNIRQIQGVITKIHAYENLMNKSVTIEFTRSLFEN